MGLLLGIDTSTTATKALVVDETGACLGTAASTYDLETPRPLWAEQDPALWWTAAQRSIPAALRDAGVDGAAIDGVGLTGQMHGLVLLDESRRVVRPAILWNDQRSARECEDIRQAVGFDELLRITGNDAFPGFTLPKLLWVRRHEPEVFRRVRHLLLPKDYLRFELTGELATDRAGAGGTLMLDLRTRDWSADLLEALDLSPAMLPPTFEGTEPTGAISPAAAAATGLRQGTPVFAGGGDQAAQAVGVGAVTEGVLALTVGTSGVVFASCPAPLIERRGRLHAFPHAVPGQWHVMGVMLSAAGSLQWFRDVVAPDEPFDGLVASADAVEPGCEGLTFLPYLSGERTPHADPEARGAFVGLTLKHGLGHLTRAVLEGVAFGLRDNMTLMREVGLGPVAEVRLSGGGARSPVWRQMLADVLGVDLVVATTTEGAALGAALLAGVGAGAWQGVAEACEAAVRLEPSIEPQPGVRGRYDESYATFRSLYPALRGRQPSGAD